MKKILLMCAVTALALAACDNNKQEARDRATNANNAVDVPAVSSATPANTDPGAVAKTTPAGTPTNIVTGAMVNTPVPSNSSAMINTPAPTVAEATVQAAATVSACGADQSWVGQNLKSIDLSKVKGTIRTIYPDQPVTMDYSEGRLNIILERGTDKVLQVKCG